MSLEVANVREYGGKAKFVKASPLHVYVGRPSVLGNPFVIGRDGDSATVIANYRHWLFERIKFDGPIKRAILALTGNELLGCWCYPETCHADVIIEAWESLKGQE